MARYVDAKSVPDDAALSYIQFSEGRMAIVRPSQWPQMSAQGLCTLPAAYGWEGFLVEADKPVATLTWFREGSAQLEKRRISISNLRPGMPVLPDRQNNEIKVKSLLSESSTIVAYYFDLPHLDDVRSNQLSPGVVNALKALQQDRPTLLHVANPASRAHQPRRAQGSSQFVELPDFQLADSRPYDVLALHLTKPGEPVSVPKFVYRSENASVSMLGIKSPPQVLFPLIKEAVALVPMAAVWYPASKQLIVVVWEDDSEEVQARLKPVN